MAAPSVERVDERSNRPARGGRQRLGPWQRALSEVGLALITLGLVIFLFIAYELWGTGLAESHSQARLKKSFDSTLAQSAHSDSPAVGANAATNPGAAVSGAIDHLVIPKIGVNKYVVQGITVDDLRQGPGHYPQTVFPGQKGNAAIAGHRTTYGAPFFRLNELSVGDDISITDTKGRTFLYRVSVPPQVVNPGDVAVLNPTPYAQLTLTTCNPRFSDTSRLIVFARLTNRPPLAVTTPTTATPATPAAPAAQFDANLGTGDSRAWTPALLYGALFVAFWVGVRVAVGRTRRWLRLAAVVGGIGLCLIALWFCFENAVLILPQNI